MKAGSDSRRGRAGRPLFAVIDRMMCQELLKTLLSILLVLVTIIVSRKFLGILTKAIEGEVATETVFSLLGLNAANTSFYPTGSGTGTAQKISNWLEIPQVLGISTSGGDARFTTISPLAKRNDINVPTGFNALSLTLTLGHDPANSNYQAMLEIARGLSKTAFKMVLSGGTVAYGYGYMSISEAPTMQRNQANQVNAAITMLGRFVSYAS